jgi:hypothetical protein
VILAGVDELLTARLRRVRRLIEALEFHRLTSSFDAEQAEEYDRHLTSEEKLLRQRRVECGVTSADFLTNELAQLRTAKYTQASAGLMVTVSMTSSN